MDNEKADELLLKGIYTSKRITRIYGKEKAKRNREREREMALQEKLAIAQLALEGTPQVSSLQAKVEEAEGALQAFMEIRTSWMLDTM